MKRLSTSLLTLAFVCVGGTSSLACEIFTPHLDVRARASEQRRMVVTEFTYPVACDEKQVLFTDLRYMQDDLDRKEVNLGLAYRRFVNNSVWGAYGFFDRRRSETDRLYSQITAGTEWLAPYIEARLNVYAPLTEEKIISQGSAATLDSIFLDGTGLFARLRSGSPTMVETPFYGTDIEIGRRLPIDLPLEEGQIKLYGGIYHFDAEDHDSISGVRSRLRLDLTERLHFSFEGQYDRERGSEGIAEVRFRIPFQSEKKKTATERAERTDRIRLMNEPIIRDVDIVTSQTQKGQTSAAQTVAVTNKDTNAAQTIYYVDNQAAGGGNGSKDTPFNTLAAAEAAAAASDIIYVYRGDGTTAGMADGITLANANQRLIGSGVDLTFSSTTFDIPNHTNMAAAANGQVLIAATTAPNITNGAGNGVNVTGNNAEIAGIRVTGAQHGILVTNANNVLVRDSEFSNNTSHGVHFLANDGNDYTFTARNATASSNTLSGILTQNTAATGRLTSTIQNARTHSNGNHGVLVYAENGGAVTGSVTDSQANNNTQHGFFGYSFGGSNIHYTASNNSADNNTFTGFEVQAGGAGSEITAFLTENASYRNTLEGYRIWSNGGDVTITMTSNIAEENDTGGFYIRGNTNGSTHATLTSNSAINNTQAGIYILSQTGNSTQAVLDRNTSNENTWHGYLLHAEAGGGLSADMQRNTATDNTGHAMQIYFPAGAGVTDVDMGGGALTSIGENRFFNNGAQELNVDWNGATLFANRNWWGVATGLDPAETTSNATIDTNNFLLNDPQ